MAELRARWARPGTKDGWLASDYFDLVREDGSAACIDDKTWADLEFPKIFSSIDSTVTPVGSQVLYRQMREYADDTEELAARYAAYRELQANVTLREKLQRALLPLREEDHARIAAFIFGPSTPLLGHGALVSMWGLASVAVLIAVVTLSWPVWIWIAMVFVNTIIIFRLYRRTVEEAETLERCLRLAGVAEGLAALHGGHPSLPCLTKLHDEDVNRKAVHRALRWLAFMKRPLVSYVVVWLNFAFLLELSVHVRAMGRLVRLRHKLAASFEGVGEIDAMIAVASCLEYCPGHCQPELTDRSELEIEDGLHPLLVGGVANSVRLDRRSALVTGSNMAGKTTFIKMLGVNALLAQTLGFCLASRAVIPRATVMASIQAAHSVASGKSHYFSEVETIHSFLARKARGGCAMFVIDELFSGTNTMERVAIAHAVLESLSDRSLVLATTHDVELQAVLEGRYDLYHFQESPEVDGFFDYRLRPGPATERNAIRLLKELGFPDGIITNAMRYAEQEMRAGGRSAVRRGGSA
ncbi:MAG TPA: hypothetical protein VFG55_05955 [Rhodanobacteraceae bacterium]|nr:hypothetical protein [Rhodanobacteraceae bacterium]